MNDSGRNQAVIGAFVVGAVALAVVAVIVFGSGKLFKDVDNFVMYFEGSVKGLNVGAPVTFRGVKVGSVTDITLRADPKNLEVRIPVVIEIDRSRIERTVDMPYSGPEGIKRLIEHGLRAKLDLQSLITGQLQVDLEFLPDEPVRLTGGKLEYMEIPTIPTTVDRLFQKLRRLPIEDIVGNLSSTLQTLERLLNNPALPEMIARLNQASGNLEVWTATLDQQTPPLVASLQQTVEHADRLILDVTSRVKPLASDADQTLKSVASAADRVESAAGAFAQLSQGAQPAIDNAGQMFANIESITRKDSKELERLDTMLREISAAARSLKNLADYLERHPESLLRGKGNTK